MTEKQWQHNAIRKTTGTVDIQTRIEGKCSQGTKYKFVHARISKAEAYQLIEYQSSQITVVLLGDFAVLCLRSEHDGLAVVDRR